MLTFVPLSLIGVTVLISDATKAEYDPTKWIAILFIVGLTAVLTYWFIFKKRRLQIDEMAIDGPFLHLNISDVAAVLEVDYLGNPTFVLYGFSGRAFMSEAGSDSAIGQLVRTLLERGLSLKETVIKPGTRLRLLTQRPGVVAVGAGSTAVPLGRFNMSLGVVRLWKRTDRDVDSLLAQTQQLGRTEAATDQQISLVIPPGDTHSQIK